MCLLEICETWLLESVMHFLSNEPWASVVGWIGLEKVTILEHEACEPVRTYWWNNYYSFWSKFISRPKISIDGGWSDWTEWSDCQSNCKNSRKRACEEPSPLFGGTNCAGLSEEETTDLCYGDECCPGDN